MQRDGDQVFRRKSLTHILSHLSTMEEQTLIQLPAHISLRATFCSLVHSVSLLHLIRKSSPFCALHKDMHVLKTHDCYLSVREFPLGPPIRRRRRWHLPSCCQYICCTHFFIGSSHMEKTKFPKRRLSGLFKSFSLIFSRDFFLFLASNNLHVQMQMEMHLAELLVWWK